MRFDELAVSLVVSTEQSGIDRYSQELAKRLPVSLIHTTRYGSMRQHLRLGRDLMRARQGVHLSNHHLGRWICWLTQPCIVTVHDLVRLAFPHAPEDRIAAVGLALDRRGIRNATHVICVSEATKRDLMQCLAVEEEKITVIYNGIDHSVFKPSPVNDGRFSAPYILYVGSERPRKNLTCLLRAFASLKDRGPRFASLRLLKVGSAGRSDGFRTATLEEARRLGIDNDVDFVDHVSDQDLAVIYSNALALVYPSLYEGFGLPVVEAMACGCPVVTTDVSSLPEVAGSAALLVDPHDPAGFAEALQSVILDRDLSTRLRGDGLRRARDFSWDDTASTTHAVYERALAGACTAVGALLPAQDDGAVPSRQSPGEPSRARSWGRTS
jgi:glycosyltransferase involved in cell wall biosynthesis